MALFFTAGALAVPGQPVGASDEELAILAASPLFWLESHIDYMLGHDSGDPVGDFLWRSRAETGVDFVPYGINKPKIVTMGEFYAARMGFDGLTNGANGHNGALIQVGSASLWTPSYTRIVVARVPADSTEGVTTAGGAMYGSNLTTGGMYAAILNGNGRPDFRHQAGTTLPFTDTTDNQDGLWHVHVTTYDDTADDLYYYRDGVLKGSNTSYSQAMSATDGALRAIIGGYGGASLTQPFIGDLAMIINFDSVVDQDVIDAGVARGNALIAALNA